MQGSHTLRHLALITSLQARSRQDASLKDSCRTNDALGCLIYKPNQTKAAWYSQGLSRTNDALGCLRNSSGCSRNTSGCPGRNTSSILTKSQALMFWNVEVWTVLIYKMDNLEPLQCTDNGKWQTGDYWNNCMFRVLPCVKVYQSLNGKQSAGICD